MSGPEDDAFERFVRTVEPGLRRALTGHLRRDQIPDALAEAFAYAWQHRDRVMAMDNPNGYLYRVAQSKSRSRRQGWQTWTVDVDVPDVEPGLTPALAELSPTQFRAVWLVHGCGWTYAETAVALDVSASTVGSHVARAMTHLRDQLGAVTNG
jgi:DNA-directed RNA polymerase specialized sigma24 family protein